MMGLFQPALGLQFDVNAIDNAIYSSNPKQVRNNDSETFWEASNGVVHRVGGPAVEKVTASGFVNEDWIVAGVLHRVDGPAIVRPNKLMWCFGGMPHRVGAPALVSVFGEEWWHNGQLHRVGGPARVRETASEFYVDGPKWEDMDSKNEWWLFGERITRTAYESFFSYVNDYFGFENIEAVPQEILEELLCAFKEKL